MACSPAVVAGEDAAPRAGGVVVQAPGQLPARCNHDSCRVGTEGARPRPLTAPYPAACRLEYLQQKQGRASSEAEREALEKQAREAEKEVQEIK